MEYGYLNFLSLSWATSRGVDTYGYNIARLDSRNTGKRYRCMGGGYDMTGTVFGKWLMFEHQDKLQALVNTRAAELVDCGYQVAGYKKLPDLYGLNQKPDGSVTVDGACGINSMIRIAEACGFAVQCNYNRKGHTTGWVVARAAE